MPPSKTKLLLSKVLVNALIGQVTNRFPAGKRWPIEEQKALDK
jgi:hypothetical protein